MEKEHIELAIQEHKDGFIEFQGRNDLHCFLYRGAWYPIRFFVNRALEIAGEETDQNLRNCLDKLQDVLPYVKQKSMMVNFNTPVPLNNEEKLIEIGILSKMIHDLTNN